VCSLLPVKNRLSFVDLDGLKVEAHIYGIFLRRFRLVERVDKRLLVDLQALASSKFTQLSDSSLKGLAKHGIATTTDEGRTVVTKEVLAIALHLLNEQGEVVNPI